MKAEVIIPDGWRKLGSKEKIDSKTDRMLWGTEGSWDRLHESYDGTLIDRRTVIRKNPALKKKCKNENR